MYKKIFFCENETWQEPNNTEGIIYENLKNYFSTNTIEFNYIAYPWGNIVDKFNGKKLIYLNLINYLKTHNIKYLFPKDSINITVFQSYHIWSYIEDFYKMNINIIFSPHCEHKKIIEIYKKFQIIVLPIFLIPIITPDYKLNEKITNIKKFNNIDKIDLEYFFKNGTYEKKEKYNISFIGSNKYNIDEVTKFRTMCINELKKKNNNYILETNQWHFNDIIYGKDDSVKKSIRTIKELNYIQNMYYSKYILCPKGIGPNSFRISETIKFNKIPIVIADKLVLPKVKGLSIDDYSIVLKENELDKINNLKNIKIDNKLKNLKIVSNYLDNLANPIIDFFDEKYNLIIVFFNININSERYKEFEYCIINNINNNDIKKIHIFFEYLDEFDFEYIMNKFTILKNEKIKVIPTKKLNSRTISFNEMFDYCNKELLGEKIIISNNDIYFENLNKIKKHDLIYKNMVIALTRTNVFDMGWEKHDLSQDSWIFVSPIIIPKKNINIGWQGCDNMLAYELYLNYNLSNPTNFIKAYHYQKKNNCKDYANKFTHFGDGLVLNVPFTNVDEICDKYNFKFVNHFMNGRLFKKSNILFYGDNYLFDKLKSKLNILKINNLENIKLNYNQILISNKKISNNDYIFIKNNNTISEIHNLIYYKYYYSSRDLNKYYIQKLININNIGQLHFSEDFYINIKDFKLNNSKNALFIGFKSSIFIKKFELYNFNKQIILFDMNIDIYNYLKKKKYNIIS